MTVSWGDIVRYQQWTGSQGTSDLRTAGLSALVPLILLVTAFVCGGASASQPLRDMIVQLAAIVLLASVALGWVGRAFSPDARIPLILIAALFVLLAFQLVPLPAAVWTALGMRAVSADILRLIGEPVGMYPLSVQPERTLLSALALLPGVAMAIAALRLETTARLLLAAGVVVGALLSLALGIVQASLGGSSETINLYQTTHAGLPIGVFANTNHQADLLVIAFVFAGLLVRRIASESASQPLRWCIYGLMAVLALGIVATGSRAGIALLGLALLAMVVREHLSGHARLVLFGAGGLVALFGVLIVFNPTIARSFADFSNLDDPRFRFWPNVTYAIGVMGWLGSGAGTFDGVYRSLETLDTLSSHYLNHAHNDYLEIVLETGVPGLVLLLATLGFLGWRGVAIIRRSERADTPASPDLAYAGMIGAGVLLLHSAADYPLRTPLLGVIFGLCCAFMTRPPRCDATYATNRSFNRPTLVRP